MLPFSDGPQARRTSGWLDEDSSLWGDTRVSRLLAQLLRAEHPAYSLAWYADAQPEACAQLSLARVNGMPGTRMGTDEPVGPSSSRLGFSLQDAPTFRVTPQQFQDPLKYIASIRRQAEPFGICKIVLQDFEPPFALNKKARFPTRVQLVHELQQRSADPAFDAAFQQRFAAFHQSQGSKAPAVTKLGNQAVELSRLLRLVLRKGGYQRVKDAKGWRDVCRRLGVRPAPAAPASGPFSSAVLHASPTPLAQCAVGPMPALRRLYRVMLAHTSSCGTLPVV